MDKNIIIDGLNIFYREEGRGEPLLLIHGMGGALVFDEVISSLAEDFRVIVIDLPGFGKSDKPDLDYTIKFYTGIINKFCEELNMGIFSIAGLSLGGMIAVTFTEEYPERIKNLFIICSAGLKSVSRRLNNPVTFSIFSLIMRLLVFSNSWALKKFQIGSYHSPEKINPKVFIIYHQFMQLPGAQRAWLSALKNVLTVDESFRKRLYNIKNKTIIIWGENDRTFPPDYAHQYHEAIKNSVLYLVKECGHTLTIEKPDEFISIVKKYKD